MADEIKDVIFAPVFFVSGQAALSGAAGKPPEIVRRKVLRPCSDIIAVKSSAGMSVIAFNLQFSRTPGNQGLP